MPVENATNISELNPNWPDPNDRASQGDDHLRLLKQVLQSQFPDAPDEVDFTALLDRLDAIEARLDAIEAKRFVELDADDGITIAGKVTTTELVSGSITNSGNIQSVGRIRSAGDVMAFQVLA